MNAAINLLIYCWKVKTENNLNQLKIRKKLRFQLIVLRNRVDFSSFAHFLFSWIFFCFCTLTSYYLHSNKNKLKVNSAWVNPAKVNLHYIILVWNFSFLEIFIMQNMLQQPRITLCEIHIKIISAQKQSPERVL